MNTIALLLPIASQTESQAGNTIAIVSIIVSSVIAVLIAFISWLLADARSKTHASVVGEKVKEQQVVIDKLKEKVETLDKGMVTTAKDSFIVDQALKTHAEQDIVAIGSIRTSMDSMEARMVRRFDELQADVRSLLDKDREPTGSHPVIGGGSKDRRRR